VNFVRVGRIARTLRRRRGWRQRDLAIRSNVSQQTVSLIERGLSRDASLTKIERVLGALEAEVDLVVRWRGGELDRVLDEGHAVLVGQVAAELASAGWLVEIELTYSRFGERGSIDVIAFHADRSALLVVEVKTEVASVEATVRKHDEKARLARTVVLERLGWSVRSTSRLLVLPAASTPRRHVARHAAVFDRAYPLRGANLRAWLREPSGPISGLLFASSTNGVGVGRALTSRRRINRRIHRPAE
jgi:transcriptional regulator with XRE-family HTH domain